MDTHKHKWFLLYDNELGSNGRIIFFSLDKVLLNLSETNTREVVAAMETFHWVPNFFFSGNYIKSIITLLHQYFIYFKRKLAVYIRKCFMQFSINVSKTMSIPILR